MIQGNSISSPQEEPLPYLSEDSSIMSNLVDFRFLSQRDSILDYFNLGGMCYGGWKCIPITISPLRPVLRCMETELSCLGDWRLRVAELGPGGGRWTFTVLDIIRTCGFPIDLEYILLGTPAEHALTHRDCLRTFFGTFPIPYNQVSRIPTGGVNQRLISEIKFTPIESLWLRAVDSHDNVFTPRIDIFIAFDSLRYLSLTRLTESIQSIRQCMVPRDGRLFMNIDAVNDSNFKQLIRRSGLEPILPPVLYDGCMYYCLRGK